MSKSARRWILRLVKRALPWWVVAVVLIAVATPLAAEPLKGRLFPGPAFLMHGTARDLMPGVPGRLRVVLANPHDVNVMVISVRVTALDAGPGCSKANLAIATFRGRVVLSPRSTETISLPITLAADAPEACRLVRFPLRFSGTAVGR